MVVVSIPGTDVGVLVKGPIRGGDGLSLLHERGLVLFRGLDQLRPVEVWDFVQEKFPGIPELVIPRGTGANNVEGLMSALGNAKDASGNYALGDVFASRHGAPLLRPTEEELVASLRAWNESREICSFLEWHIDQLFTPSPPSYNALFCEKPGGSATGWSDACVGLQQLPEDLRAYAEQATIRYRPAIMYNLPSRKTQIDGSEFLAKMTKEDPEWSHKLVQVHPHTGEKSLRLGDLRTLHTLDDLPPARGAELAWRMLKAATAEGNAYVHKWRAGDLIVWDQRRVLHARLPYDTEREERRMWRMEFKRDPLDKEMYAAAQHARL